MIQDFSNNSIRELTFDELFAVSGGTKVCSYEVADKCYVWRDQSAWEQWVAAVESVASSLGR